MNRIDIDKEEILKTSKWVRFIFMVVYAFVINFVLTICIGLAFIQFLFFLFTSKVNGSIANFNSHIIEFFHDCIAFLLFATEDKPFPFKSNDIVDENTEEAEIIEAEVASTDSDEDKPSEVKEEKDK
jgi:hypothetical protein